MQLHKSTVATEQDRPQNTAVSDQLAAYLKRMKRPLWNRLIILAGITLVLVIIFLTLDINGQWDYALPRRMRKVGAMILVGYAIGVSTIIFMTITNNRILTPSIIGFDALYVLIQTVIVFLFGAATIIQIDNSILYVMNVFLLVVFAGLLYGWLFKREGNDLYFLVLVGIIFGILFRSLTVFMGRLISPNDFMILQDLMFASFNVVDMDLLLVSTVLILLVSIFAFRYTKYLDVISLGREQAINLGVNHHQVVNRLLIAIAIFSAVATALVGPMLFLGLLVANLAHQFMKTYRHAFLFPAVVLISVIALVGGQLLVEHLFEFATSLSVIINFVGGIYFIVLLLRGEK